MLSPQLSRAHSDVLSSASRASARPASARDVLRSAAFEKSGPGTWHPDRFMVDENGKMPSCVEDALKTLATTREYEFQIRLEVEDEFDRRQNGDLSLRTAKKTKGYKYVQQTMILRKEVDKLNLDLDSEGIASYGPEHRTHAWSEDSFEADPIANPRIVWTEPNCRGTQPDPQRKPKELRQSGSARFGAFEPILFWRKRGEKRWGQCVLHSKLETLEWPNIKQICTNMRDLARRGLEERERENRRRAEEELRRLRQIDDLIYDRRSELLKRCIEALRLHCKNQALLRKRGERRKRGKRGQAIARIKSSCRRVLAQKRFRDTVRAASDLTRQMQRVLGAKQARAMERLWAVLVLQSECRRLIPSRTFFETKKAAMTIVSMTARAASVRAWGKKIGSSCVQQARVRCSAALIAWRVMVATARALQGRCRCYVQREAWLGQLCAAADLNKCARRYLAMGQYSKDLEAERRSRAGILFSSMARRGRAWNRFRLMKVLQRVCQRSVYMREMEAKRGAGAVLARALRCRIARAEFRARVYGAQCVVSILQRLFAVKAYQKQRAASARTLQRSLQCRCARVRVRRRRSTLLVQAAMRRTLAVLEARNAVMRLRLQAVTRRCLARRRYLALRILRWLRRLLARHMVQRMQAVGVVQAVIRRSLRHASLRRNVAAVRIQCGVRQHWAKHAAHKVRMAMRLQGAVRAFRARRALRRLGPAEQPVAGRSYLLYHATSPHEAARIEQQGFRRARGVLGSGVYLSRDPEVARSCSEGEHGVVGVVLAVAVLFGEAGRIDEGTRELVPDIDDQEGTPWHDDEYLDSVWRDPDCPDTVFHGIAVRETDCVWDLDQLAPLKRVHWATTHKQICSVTWYHERKEDPGGDEGEWVAFSKEMSFYIESHHRLYSTGQGQNVIRVRSDGDRQVFADEAGSEYSVDFGLMLQEKIGSGLKKKRIRRDDWGTLPATELQARLRRLCERGLLEQKRGLLKQTRMASRIQRAYRIYLARRHWRLFRLRLLILQCAIRCHRARHAPRMLREDEMPEQGRTYVMFHGTSPESAALIEQNGFQPSSGGLLGPGVYVSRDVRKAQMYSRRAAGGLKASKGVVLEVEVELGRVCKIDDHPEMVPGGWSTESPWHDASPPYDSAWVSKDCPSTVFSGAHAGLGIVEEDCVWDREKVKVVRRAEWDTDVADITSIQWMFEEDEERLSVHSNENDEEVSGRWVSFSKENSFYIESHYRIYKNGTGKPVCEVKVEKDRKRFNQHTGLAYTIDFIGMKETNVQTKNHRNVKRVAPEAPIDSESQPSPLSSADTEPGCQPCCCLPCGFSKKTTISPQPSAQLAHTAPPRPGPALRMPTSSSSVVVPISSSPLPTRSRRSRRLCWAIACCCLILVLAAIIIIALLALPGENSTSAVTQAAADGDSEAGEGDSGDSGGGGGGGGTGGIPGGLPPALGDVWMSNSSSVLFTSTWATLFPTNTSSSTINTTSTTATTTSTTSSFSTSSSFSSSSTTMAETSSTVATSSSSSTTVTDPAMTTPEPSTSVLATSVVPLLSSRQVTSTPSRTLTSSSTTHTPATTSFTSQADTSSSTGISSTPAPTAVHSTDKNHTVATSLHTTSSPATTST